MQFAILNGNKVEATPQQKANCPLCGHNVISRCGELKIWHWAHTVDDNCDNWYEPETKWHRDWKKIFGNDNSEVIIVKNEIKHIADVYTNDRIVIELQNSPISTETIKARESFYGDRMLWIINADPFLLNVSISGKHRNYETSYPENLIYSEDLLPHAGWFLDFGHITPDAVYYEFLNVQYGFTYKPAINKYFRLGTSDYQFSKFFLRLLREFNEKHGIAQPNDNTLFLNWKYAHKSWTVARRPAFIDYNNQELFLVKSGLGTSCASGVIVEKKKFIFKYRR